jgi:hypothetical protein
VIALIVPPKILFCSPNPAIVVTQRVSTECGCSVFIGKRFDNFEVSTIASACSPEHDTLVRRFNDLLLWSLADGGNDRLLADVVDELLVEAHAEVAA